MFHTKRLPLKFKLRTTDAISFSCEFPRQSSTQQISNPGPFFQSQSVHMKIRSQRPLWLTIELHDVRSISPEKWAQFKLQLAHRMHTNCTNDSAYLNTYNIDRCPLHTATGDLHQTRYVYQWSYDTADGISQFSLAGEGFLICAIHSITILLCVISCHTPCFEGVGEWRRPMRSITRFSRTTWYQISTSNHVRKASHNKSSSRIVRARMLACGCVRACHRRSRLTHDRVRSRPLSALDAVTQLAVDRCCHLQDNLTNACNATNKRERRANENHFASRPATHTASIGNNQHIQNTR